MKHYIFPLAASMITMASCFSDESTVDTVRISEISIDTLRLQREYNIDKNETLSIEPVIVQAVRDLELTYEWEVSYELYSGDAALEFTGDELGSFPARLKVSNEHGSAFYQFTIHVNSPYEEGVTVLSEDDDGTMMLSIMRKYSNADIAAGKVEFFNTNCLTTNNPDITFAKHPTDVIQRGRQLFVSCIGDAIVYVVNDKTLEMENIIVTPEYTNFKPMRMMIYQATGRSAPTICEDGTVYNLASLEQVVLPHSYLTSNYAQVNHGSAGAYQIYYHLWDNNKQLLGFFDGYSVWFGEAFDPPYLGHEPIAMFDNMKTANSSTFTMISHKDGEFWQTTLTNTGKLYDSGYTVIGVDMHEHFRIGGTKPDISARTPFVSSPVYRGIYYAVGNKIYRKYFSDTDFPSSPWVTIDLSGAEITSLAISPDETQLYVGVHQNGSGLDGHIYILNSLTGAHTSGSPYMNVGYKPVKIMYKTK